MKNFNKWVSVLLSVCLLLSMAVPTVFAADAGTTVVLDPEKIITENFIGLGFQWDGYAHADSETESFHDWGIKLSEEDWNTVLTRVAYMKPQFMRIMLKSDWWYRTGVDENGNPTVDFETEEMQIVCDKILDFCQETGVTVMFGEWDPDDNPNWGWTLAECVNYLVNTRGYTCIKYVNVQNCVRNYEMESWRGYVRNLYDELDLRGLLGKVEILGPDDQINNPNSPTSNFLQRVVDDPELSKMMGAYESHHYTPYQEQIEAMTAYVEQGDPENKPFIIGETGIMPQSSSGVPHTGHDSNVRVYDYSYGIDMAQYTAAMVNGGAAAISVWDLDDATHWGSTGSRDFRRWGFWNILGTEMYNMPEDENIRPWFYTYSLMTRNLPAGSIILDTDSVDTNNIQTMAALVPKEDGTYGVTLMGVNKSNQDQTITFKLPEAAGNIDFSEYHYFDGDRLVDENGFPVATTVQKNVNLAQGVTMKVKAGGVAFLLSEEANSSVALNTTIPEPEPYYQTQPITDQVIVDNTDKGFTSSGDWQSTTKKVGFVGNDYLEDGTDAADGDAKWARWTPELAKAGYYDVYVGWPRGRDKMVSYLPVTVGSAAGEESLIMAQNDDTNGYWHKVGTYEFEAGSDGYVQLTAKGYGRTVADGARFVYRGTEDPDEKTEYQVILTHYDNSSPDVTKTGEWRQSSLRGYADKYGAYFASDGNSAKGTKTYKFSPLLKYGGTYQMEIFYPTGDFAPNVPVDITDGDGNTVTVTVDESQNGGKWNVLGTYHFDSGRGASVTMRTDGTSKTVIANAVRFVLLEQDADPTANYNCIIDEMNDWSMIYDRSDNLMFEEPKLSEYDDGSRVKRGGTAATNDIPSEIVYAYENIKKAVITTFFDEAVYTADKESVWMFASSDGKTWTRLETMIDDLGKVSTHRKYQFTAENLPENTNYIKIVLQNYQPVFYPQVGKVTLYTDPTGAADCLSVNLYEKLVTVNTGNTYQLTPTFGPMDAARPDVTYTSSNEDVLTVDENGLVTAIAQGSAKVTVSTADGLNDSAVFNVTTSNLALGKEVWASKTSDPVSYSPSFAVDGSLDTRWSTGETSAASFMVKLGSVQQVAEVRIVWAGSAGKNMTIEVTEQNAAASEKEKWTTVASYTGLNQSNYTQTIRFNPVSASSVLVRAPSTTSKYGLGIHEIEIYGPSNYVAVASVTMPNQLTVTEGDTVQLEAQVSPAEATYGDVVYTFSDSHVVNMVNGQLKAIAPGECTVTATADGISASTKITVEALPDAETVKAVETKEGPVIVSISDVDAGAIPAGTKLAAKDDYENSKDIALEDENVVMAFDLALTMLDDSPTEISGKVQVSLQLPDGFYSINDGELRVYTLDENNAPTALTAQTQQQDGKWFVVFNTDALTRILLTLPEVPTVTAQDIANTIAALTAPEKDATKLILPTVEGYTIAIHSSSDESVIDLDGEITPPEAETEVTLVLSVTSDLDSEDTALTGEIKVTVPAKTAEPEPDPDQEAADEVDQLIANLGEITSPDQKDAVEAVRAAYEALTDAQKALVKNLAALEAAEEALEAFEPQHPAGDVDGSGTVDVADIMKLKALIMADKWSAEELAIGDLNESDALDVGDIMAVKNIIMSA